jgi:ABC-type uncharacterized transport system fused permease/ATPase subunit
MLFVLVLDCLKLIQSRLRCRSACSLDVNTISLVVVITFFVFVLVDECGMVVEVIGFGVKMKRS